MDENVLAAVAQTFGLRAIASQRLAPQPIFKAAMGNQTMKKVFNLVRNVWKDFIWGVLFAALGVICALLFLEQTSYAYWIEKVLSNGHGPYEISIATIVITLAILNAKKYPMAYHLLLKQPIRQLLT